MHKSFSRYLLILSCFLGSFLSTAQESSTETQIQYLSGKGYQHTKTWDFKVSKGRNSGDWKTIEVPSVWEQQGYGKYQYGIRFYGKPHPEGIADEVGTYKYKFTVPKAWENRKINIVFEASMTDTEVRINGRSAGEKHQGAFYTFKYDITNLLKFGKENLLEVTVSKESEDGSVNLAERRADYWNFGGIFRPVYLESFPPQYIKRTALYAEADGSFKANVFLGHGGSGLRAEAEVIGENGKKTGKTLTAELAQGSDKLSLSGSFNNINQWTAETPNLYGVNIKLFKDKTLLHQVSDTIGFRTIEIKKEDGIYVNGQKVIFKGINRHSFWPESGRTLNKKLNYNDVKLIKEMNMNAVRLSHYPPDPDFLRACDKLGLYVMDELGGWHGHYDDGIGKKLIHEMVVRDVNHPSIIFWSNGNEGGWNTSLDNQFDIWDIQNRPVLHPQQELNGVETMHYRSYGETQEYLRGKEIFMPTEFLHGLYDGGHGAGLNDYWEMMRKDPHCAGGFLWVYADEGIARTDQNGRIDNQGNYGADGIVGPHHEKEGSFFTVKEIWSPVMLMDPEKLPTDFDGKFAVENRYDFINLSDCTFEWELADFPNPTVEKGTHKTVEKGTLKGPDLAAQQNGTLAINLPNDWKNADVLYVKAMDPNGKELWTWNYTWEKKKPEIPFQPSGNSAVSLTENEDSYNVNSGDTEIHISKETGKLSDVSVSGNAIDFKNGPNFFVARRGDRTIDGTVDKDAAKGEDRIYEEIKYDEVNYEAGLKDISAEKKGDSVVIAADYSGSLQKITWIIKPGGRIQLDYNYQYNGVVELAGVTFDYPEEQMKAKKWLGDGPYRVWQNRLKGTKFDVWQNDYNDPIPGESFDYPEFKGYFNHWRWVGFKTTQGTIYMANDQPNTYLGVYTPRDGRDALLYTLPKTGIAVFDVIPAIRNKVNATDLVGPSSQPKWLEGVQKHTLYFKFEAK